MAEFKFSCPQCGQHILCDVGYSGVQINCPTCKQAIIVPQAPRSAAAPPAPPAPPSMPSTLSTQRPTSTPSVPTAGMRAAAKPPEQIKGSGAMKTVLVITAVVVALAVLGGGGWFGYKTIKARHEAAVAAKGNPAAQVPVPSVAQNAGALDILAKVHDAYTNVASLNVEGTSSMVIDMSQVTAADMNPNMTDAQKKAARRPANIPKAITNSTDITIKLARPDLYLIEGIAKMQINRMNLTNTTAVWSSGQTNYTLMVMGGGTYKKFTTVADRKTALMATGQSGGLAMGIAQLFFDEPSDMDKFITDWGQTDDDSVDGQDCYTLTAKMMGQKLKLWVSKSSYMFLQSQITLGAPVSDADIEAMMSTFDTNTNKTPAQLEKDKAQAKQQAAMMTKIRGVITETYDNIQTNQTFTADDFNYPVPRGVRFTPPKS